MLSVCKLPVIFAAHGDLMSRLTGAFGHAYLKFTFAQRWQLQSSGPFSLLAMNISREQNCLGDLIRHFPAY